MAPTQGRHMNSERETGGYLLFLDIGSSIYEI